LTASRPSIAFSATATFAPKRPKKTFEIPSEVAMIIDNDNREITETIGRHKAKSL
jgi:hypothetical protein